MTKYGFERLIFFMIVIHANNNELFIDRLDVFFIIAIIEGVRSNLPIWHFVTLCNNVARRIRQDCVLKAEHLKMPAEEDDMPIL